MSKYNTVSEDGGAKRKLGWAREQKGDLDIEWECVRAPCRRGCTRQGEMASAKGITWQFQHQG